MDNVKYLTVRELSKPFYDFDNHKIKHIRFIKNCCKNVVKEVELNKVGWSFHSSYITTTDNVIVEYLYYFLQDYSINKDIPTIFDTVIPVPSLERQQKIVDCLKNLDEMTNLYGELLSLQCRQKQKCIQLFYKEVEKNEN